MAEEPPRDHAGLEVLDPATCERLLESTPVGRIGFTHEGKPFVLPVNYRWRHESVVFRTAAGHKLAAALDVSQVAFEVDSWDAEQRGGWSVLLRGTASVIDDENELLDLEALADLPWVHNADKPFWVRLVPEEMTGRTL